MHTQPVTTVLATLLLTLSLIAQPQSIPHDSSATRPLITSFGLSGDFISRAPIRGDFEQFYDQISGTVVQDYRGVNYLHVRGSRGDEVAYQLNGRNIRSAFSGQPLIRLIPEALARLDIDKAPGAANAAAPAVVEHTIRTADRPFALTLRADGDPFTSANKSLLDTYSYGYYNLLGLVESRLWNNRINFIAAVENEHFNDHYRRFWEGFDYTGEIFEADSRTGESLEQITGSTGLALAPGNISQSGSDRWTSNARLAMDIRPLMVELLAATNQEKYQINDRPVEYQFNLTRIPEKQESADLFSLAVSTELGRGVTASLGIDRLSYQNECYDPLLNGDLFAYGNVIQPMIFNYIWRFSRPGQILTNYSKANERQWALRMQAGKKIGGHHLSTGLRYRRWHIRSFATSGSYKYYFRNLDPESRYYDNILRSMAAGGFDLLLGYDQFGKPLDNDSEYLDRPARPRITHFFFQDHWRSGPWQIKAGLQYVRFNADQRTFPGITYEDFYEWGQGFNVDADMTGEFAPAAGIWLPNFHSRCRVNDRLSLVAGYGKFASMPRLREVYRQRMWWWREATGGYFPDDVAPFEKISPVITRQGEIGVVWNKGNWRGHTTLYTKQSLGYLQTASINRTVFDYTFSAAVLNDNGAATARGVETDLRFQSQTRQFHIGYSYSRVSGSSSYSMSNYWLTFRNNLRIDYEYFPVPEGSHPLDFDRRHDLFTAFSYRFHPGQNTLLKNMGFHTHFRFNSGHAAPLVNYTVFGGPLWEGVILPDEEARIRSGVPYYVTTPWQYFFDMMLDRTFQVAGSAVRAFVYIQNLFNRKNVNHVYRSTGSDSYDGYDQPLFPTRLTEENIALHEQINLQHRQHYSTIEGGDIYAHPREIRFGVEMNIGK